MKKVSKSLESVLKFRRWQEDSAAQTLRDLASKKLTQENRLKQLTVYRDEYRTGYSAMLQEGATSDRMSEYRRMITTLDSAVRQETENMQQLLNHWQRGKEHWQRAHQQSEAIAEVRDRKRQQQDQRQQSLDQLMQDELSARSRAAFNPHSII